MPFGGWYNVHRHMNLAIPIIGLLAVCWLLGTAKKAAKRKRQRTTCVVKSDLVRISDCCECSFSEPCAAWHGRIVSRSVRTPGFMQLAKIPTRVRSSHNLEYVDETVDAAEIALQKAHPVRDFSPEGLKRNLYEMDIARYVRKGKSRAAAIAAVARDRLEREIRVGLVVETQAIMSNLTDAQVLALCPNGNPPIFEPFKATKKEIREGAHESYRNGVVTIKRDGLTAERIKTICRL